MPQPGRPNARLRPLFAGESLRHSPETHTPLTPMGREPKSTRRQFGAASLLLCLAASCGTDSANETSGPLYFSAIPDDNESELAEQYGKIATYLTEELGIEVIYQPSSSYDASVEAFKNGDIHLAWFGGVSGVQARAAVDGSRAIAQGKVDPNYYSYFIAHKDTGIEPGDSFPMGLEGKSFTFGARNSTSGRVMPEHFIRTNTAKTPEEFFGSEPRFSNAHNITAEWVQDRTVDAGALSYKTYDKLVKNGTIDPEVCRIVWKTPGYPDYNWTAHPALDGRFGEGFTEKLQKVLVEIEDPALLDALLRPEGMIEATNADFEAIERTMELTGLARG